MRRLRAPALALTALLLLASAACGSTEDPSDASEIPRDEAAEPVTFTDSRGDEITLEDGPAERVVALEWMHAEVLATLGVMPVGVADVDGYATWDRAEPLDGSVTDVGTRTEPSEDAVLQLDPDLVLVEAGSEAFADQISDRVDVAVLHGSDASDNLGHMRETVTTIATAVGAEDRATEVLEQLDADIEQARTALADAGLEGEPFLLADGYQQGSSFIVRVFAEGSLMSDLAEAAGLDNAWTGEGDEVWGLDETDLEGLVGLPDLRFFYSASDEDPIADGSLSSPVFDRLPFVQSGQVYKLEPGTWTFGGPASASRFLDQLVQHLAG